MKPPRAALAGSPLTWVALATAGVATMILATPIAAASGVHAALIVGELALATPTLLGLVLLAVPAAGWYSSARFGIAEAFLSGTGGVALWVTSLGLFALQTIAWPPPPSYLESFQALHEALRPSGPLDAGLSLLAVSLAPALGEEVVFRGALLTSLRSRFGATAAVLLTALAFGSIHVDVVAGAPMMHRIPFAILIGLGLGALRVKTGSLLGPLLAHATVNTLTFAAVLAGLDDTSAQPTPELGRAVGLLLGGGAATIVLLALRIRGRLGPAPPADVD